MARPGLAAVAGTVVGALLVVPLAVVDGDDEPAAGRLSLKEVDAEAAAALIDAWERSRTTTWRMEGTFTRQLANGRSLQAETLTVQRPPERLEVALGSVEGRRDGVRFACSAADDGELRCREAESRLTYAQELAQEIRRLEALVTEEGEELALYAVDERDGCFELELRFPFPAPPYGEAATFCFAADTGAPVRTVIRRAEGVDTTVASRVTGQVTDADLRPPEVVDVPVIS